MRTSREPIKRVAERQGKLVGTGCHTWGVEAYSSFVIKRNIAGALMKRVPVMGIGSSLWAITRSVFGTTWIYSTVSYRCNSCAPRDADSRCARPDFLTPPWGARAVSHPCLK